ncbi:MAG: folylpolyglutamate synthase/dihydrofolate synthase family protein [Ferruginibacter sp.]
MTYQETIEYLYQHLPMFSRIGAAAYKKDLHNTIELCAALDNPQQHFKTIHIAGTNGKGSTSHMLAAVLQQAGYKTGLYTSPHLKDFRERIKINGAWISEIFVIDFVEKTKALSENIQPSFFELTVAMAFEYFAQQKVDIAVIETGLGGRLDSTNIITPVLSVITNIGYDHMNLLGNTLEEIAAEKAGIIKPGIPVVIGEYLPETKPIFENKAKAAGAPIYFASEEYAASDIISTVKVLHCKVSNIPNDVAENFTLDLNGLYQIKNLCTVLCAEGILMQKGFTITNEAEKFALANTKQLTGLHGRWDVIAENPTIVLDVAHNEDGIKQVLKQVRENTDVRGKMSDDRGQMTEDRREITVERIQKIEDRRIHFVIGMVKDKEVSKVLSLLPTDANYYFTHAHIPRAMDAAELKEKAAVYHLTGDHFDNVNAAIAAAKANAAAADLIIVCGSVFLVGEVELQRTINN